MSGAFLRISLNLNKHGLDSSLCERTIFCIVLAACAGLSDGDVGSSGSVAQT